MLRSQMTPQRINPAVRRRTIRTNGPLWRMRMKMMPAVRDFLGARTTLPQERIRHRLLKHIVVSQMCRRHSRMHL